MEPDEASVDGMQKIAKAFTMEAIDSWLRKEESTQKGALGSGIRSWSAVRCASNPLCEDNYVASQRIVSGSSKPWSFWGVFDGHGEYDSHI
jgi:hypothetical protein